jgi:hypothetical protein
MSQKEKAVSRVEAAQTLLKKAYVKADGSQLAKACKELCDEGLCEFVIAQTSPIVFPARYKATKRTQEALRR